MFQTLVPLAESAVRGYDRTVEPPVPLYVKVWIGHQVDYDVPVGFDPLTGEFSNSNNTNRPPGFSHNGCLFIWSQLPQEMTIDVLLIPQRGLRPNRSYRLSNGRHIFSKLKLTNDLGSLMYADWKMFVVPPGRS